jgi:hypothetical protein
MMFERASPSLQSRKLLGADGQGRAGNMLSGNMLMRFRLTGFAGHPAPASNRIDAHRRNHVTDNSDASAVTLPTKAAGGSLPRHFVNMQRL